MIQDILVIASTVFNALAGAADASISESGYKKGYNEANSWLVGLFGVKPKGWQLDVYNLTWTSLFVALMVFGRHNPAVFGFGVGGQLLNGASHIRSYFSWKKAFSTNGASLTAKKSLWQKLFW